MTDPELDSLSRIADDLRVVATSLTAIVDRVSTHVALERRLPQPSPEPERPAPQPQAAAVPVPVAASAERFDWDAWRAGNAWATERPAVEPPSTGLRKAWDSGRALAWVGSTVTVIGVVLLVVLASQRGWLGPVPRLIAGAVLAVALLGASLGVHRTPAGRNGAFALAATGFATLYLDAIGATVLYHAFSPVIGLVIAFCVAAAGLYLADRWESPVLAMFVVVAAAVCAPVLTGLVSPLLVAFLLVLACVATPVQIHRNWPYLAIAAQGAPLLFGLVLDAFAVRDDLVTQALVVALAAVVCCLTLAIVIVLRRGADDPVGIALVIVSPIQAMAAAPLQTTTSAVTSLGCLTVVLFALWLVHRTTHRLPPNFAAAAGVAAAATMAQATSIALAHNASVLTITLLCQAMLVALVAVWTPRRGTLLLAGGYGLVGLCTAVVGPFRLYLLVVPPLGDLPHSTLVPALITAALVVGVAGLFGWAMLLGPESRATGVWLAVAAVALYGSSGVLLFLTMLVWPDAAGFRTGHVVITIGWTVCALVLLAKGVTKLPARIAGLSLVGAALAKLFLFDLIQLDGLVRVVAFLVVGIVLLVAGVRYAKLIARAGGDGGLRSHV